MTSRESHPKIRSMQWRAADELLAEEKIG